MALPSRILFYSHDSFGLGHLRRCRALAHGLVERFPELSCLILSGSPIIGSFEFRTQVDFVRIPGIIKLRNGDYQAMNLPFALDETLRLRKSVIAATAEAFAPDVLIVDKEPLGLRGELAPVLPALKARGTRLVLGLRDILDEPEALAAEWQRKQVGPALEQLYDEIWVYGVEAIHRPLAGLDLAPGVAAKLRYTGYLRRAATAPATPPDPYVLVMTGGGGDGDNLVDQVLAAYETGHVALPPATVLLGPFMPAGRRAGFLARAGALPKLTLHTFDARPEALIQGAGGIVAMGGYNTFCEILSFDRPALIVPREAPRREQAIRAERAAALGLVSHLTQAQAADAALLAGAIAALPGQAPPSARLAPGWIDGMRQVAALLAPVLSPKMRQVS